MYSVYGVAQYRQSNVVEGDTYIQTVILWSILVVSARIKIT